METLPADAAQLRLEYRLSEIEHRYGPGIHILADHYLNTMLARLCDQTVVQPEANRLVKHLYSRMFEVMVNSEFPRKQVRIKTRMAASTERAVLQSELIDRDVKVAVASVARAGNLPAQEIFDALSTLLNSAGVRLDAFFVSRNTDSAEHVTGADVASSKIGGGLDDRLLLIPDPMGATGSSVVQVLDVYKHNVPGTPLKKILMHLIITPEYVRRLRQYDPEVIVYALRLDRGLSDPDVLGTVPGTFWDRERGLNEKQYIVPGAGGLGELITNSYV